MKIAIDSSAGDPGSSKPWLTTESVRTTPVPLARGNPGALVVAKARLVPEIGVMMALCPLVAPMAQARCGSGSWAPRRYVPTAG